jgi:hypothetical protein
LVDGEAGLYFVAAENAQVGIESGACGWVVGSAVYLPHERDGLRGIGSKLFVKSGFESRPKAVGHGAVGEDDDCCVGRLLGLGSRWPEKRQKQGYRDYTG